MAACCLFAKALGPRCSSAMMSYMRPHPGTSTSTLPRSTVSVAALRKERFGGQVRRATQRHGLLRSASCSGGTSSSTFHALRRSVGCRHRPPQLRGSRLVALTQSGSRRVPHANHRFSNCLASRLQRRVGQTVDHQSVVAPCSARSTSWITNRADSSTSYSRPLTGVPLRRTRCRFLCPGSRVVAIADSAGQARHRWRDRRCAP